MAREKRAKVREQGLCVCVFRYLNHYHHLFCVFVQRDPCFNIWTKNEPLCFYIITSGFCCSEPIHTQFSLFCYLKVSFGFGVQSLVLIYFACKFLFIIIYFLLF